MAYSKVGIINMALARIGQPKISQTDEESAIQSEVIWEFMRDEVLESTDWTFAKTRKVLALNTTAPVQAYSYAYTLPPDFLRLCRDRADDPPVSYISSESLLIPSSPLVSNTYVIESLADGTECLFTNFDNSTDDLVIQYIRKENNPARYTAHFCSTLAYRIAAELAMVLTEDRQKHDSMISLYDAFLKRAKAHNMSGDYLRDETGNSDWENAGR